MNADWMAFYRNAESAAKTNAELFQSRSHRMTELLNEGYRYWLHGFTATLGDTAKAFEELSKCRSSTDFADVQRSWIESTASRRLEDMKRVMDLANTMLNELAANVAQAQDDAKGAQALVVRSATTAEPKAEPQAAPQAAPESKAEPESKSAPKAAKPVAAPKAAKAPAAKSAGAKPVAPAAAPAPTTPAAPTAPVAE
ncbi:MAG TPA: hypothetical protein VEB64_04900 [Azospirillaceae bacterium]|nr:hypothetical protein [Azospirillaceae bacterium]